MSTKSRDREIVAALTQIGRGPSNFKDWLRRNTPENLGFVKQ